MSTEQTILRLIRNNTAYFTLRGHGFLRLFTFRQFRKYPLIIAAAMLMSCAAANAQKYEQESRIKTELLPSAIIAYLDQHYPERSKLRHYEEYSKREEEDKLQRFYESKFNSGGYRYSVKFDSSGQLYDTERIVAVRHLPEPILRQIKEDLSLYFQRHRIKKVQEIIDKAGKVVGYELVLRGRRNQDVGYFELQYDATAQRVSATPIQEALNPFFFF